MMVVLCGVVIVIIVENLNLPVCNRMEEHYCMWP